MVDAPHDPRLPDLAAALDNAIVQADLAARWDRPARAVAVRRTDAEYQPGQSCTVTYELSGEIEGTPQRTYGAVRVTPSGRRTWLAEEDPALPGLTPVLRGCEPRELTASSGICRVEPVKYRPGQRCVVRFDAPSGEAAFFGKLFAGEVSRRFEALQALSSAPDGPPVSPPAGCWPRLGLLVQPAVRPGISLAVLGLDLSPDAASWMRRAGRSIGLLHTVRWQPHDLATLRDDVDHVHRFRHLFECLAPRLTAEFDTALTCLRAQAASLREPAPVTSHGALRLRQLLVDERDRVVLVDLDGCCRASPARDPANLLAYLDWRAIREPGLRNLLSAAGAAFLDGYATAAPAPDPPALQLYRAVSLLKIAGRRLRRLETGSWPLLPSLLERAAEAAQVD